MEPLMRLPASSAVLFLSLMIPFPASPQSLDNSDFKIEFSSAGITSLKRVHDKYDTDYIARGHAVGDLIIRYRATGEKDWEKASGAVLDSGSSPAQSSVSFTIGELIPTLAARSRLSASVRSQAVQVLNGQLLPQNSRDEEVPRFFWYGRDGTSEWVQYDFPEAKEVRSIQIYWALHEEDRNPGKLPQSWRLLYRDGENWKEVSPSHGYPLSADQVNDMDFAPVTTSALRIEVQLQKGATAGLYRWGLNGEGRKVAPIKDLQASETFRLQNGALSWTISLKNPTAHEIEIGDLALPLPFNTQYVWDKTETYTKRLIPHTLIAGNGSFLFWMRTNTEGPYLVMTPAAGCGLEYFEPQRFGNGVAYYVHSAASGEELKAKGGGWRLPQSRLILKPGGSETCQFRFRWASDYNAVRQVLYEEGLFDVNVVPGMTIPADLSAMFSLRTHNRIGEIAAEFPQATRIEYLGERGKDVHVYRARFSHLGENLLKVKYGNGQYLSLEFFVTEPLETLFKKRASFLVSHEQIKDSSKWYNSVFSQWDMKHEILRGTDDLDGMQSYVVSSDDLAKLYPSMTKYLDKEGYLERAFGTAKAFFTVPMDIVQWSAYETGTYNELVIPDLIDALNENGHKDQADWLKTAWEKKVKHFI